MDLFRAAQASLKDNNTRPRADSMLRVQGLSFGALMKQCVRIDSACTEASE